MGTLYHPPMHGTTHGYYMARPRLKNVTRHPCGKPVPRKDDHIARAELRASMHGLQCEANDTRAGYPLGRLNLRGLISDAQLNASNRFAELAIRWSILDGKPNQTAKGLDMNNVRGLDIHREPDDEYIVRVKAEYNNALSALVRDTVVGRRSMMVMNAIRDGETLHINEAVVVHACKVLAWHFGYVR